MKELVFATQNPAKAEEIGALLGGNFKVKSLYAVGITEELPETTPTLEGNALMKARYVHEKTGIDCFADDTGLEVDVLNGEPGVYSARYAGGLKDADNNMNLLLEKLQGHEKPRAHFRTVIALILDGKEHLFEGIAEGHIIREKRGQKGFGYDPVFVPTGHTRTFAEMDLEEKNRISHRAKAFEAMKEFLSTQQQ